MAHQDTQPPAPQNSDAQTPTSQPAEAARDQNPSDKPQDPPVITDYASL